MNTFLSWWYSLFPPKTASFLRRTGTVNFSEHTYRKLWCTNDDGLADVSSGWGLCFPWALCVAYRHRGRVESAVTAREWTQVRKDSRASRNGTNWADVLKYFLERQATVEMVSVDLDGANALHYAANKMNSGWMGFLTLEVTISGRQQGHMEAIVGIENDKVITNSWGQKAECGISPYLIHPYQTQFNVDPATIRLLLVRI